jgi:hypothetical protein
MKKLLIVLIFFISIISSKESYCSVRFDAVDDLITISSWSDLTAFSISAWIYPISLGEGSIGRIVHIGNGSDASDGALSLEATNRLRFFIVWSGTDGDWNTGNNSLVLNQWHHVAVTYDGSSTSNVPSFYIDGVLQTTSVVLTPTLARETQTQAYIGNRSNTTATFNGSITDVAIWNKVISDIEVKKIYLSKTKNMPLQISPSSLVGYWPLDDFSDLNIALGSLSIKDRSHIYRNATPSGGLIGEAESILSYA